MKFYRRFLSAASIARKHIIAGARWWLTEIQGLIPLQFANFFWKPKALLTLSPTKNGIEAILTKSTESCKLPSLAAEPSPTQIENFQAALQSKLGSVSPQTLIDLDDKNLLIIHVDYPIAAEATLEKILLNEFNRITPFKVEDVYWDWTVHKRDIQNKRLVVKIVLAKRAVIDKIIAQVNKYKVFPLGIRLREPQKVSEPFYRLLPAHNGTHKQQFNKFNFGLNLAFVLLLPLLVWSIIFRAQKLEAQLMASIVEMKPAIEELEKTRKNLDLLNQAVRELEAQKKTPTNLTILGAITRLMPDDTWIFDFQLNNGEIRASGFSIEPSKLIGLINACSLFTNATFLSAVTTSSNGAGQRFDLSFTLKPPAGSP